MHRPALPPLPPTLAGSPHSTPRDSKVFAPGSVCLVGAGPGDPDLLTLRAVQRLGQADVLLYDHLLDPQILRLAPPQASRICVGKRASRHTLPQADINQLLIDFARNGQRVVRLKGGDPLLFGRGGEEILALAAAGIPCEVVPGISAALGAAAALGLPLTHRDHAQGCSLVTGHRRQGESALDWTQHSTPEQTLVVYMGLGEAAHIASQLLAHGRDPATPVAIVERACSSAQRCVCGQLATLAQLIADQQIASPALLIIGSVVSLHQQLQALRQQAVIS
ncbi:uroporphyrinogen-III C-methyltransferase [Aquitalea sp. ASV11]|uniref:uroporphyrinogen-III C-methyltransferase n=1 Tax=Aquitalea sp. ASV11 TaxID=2795103 RepID=UPI0018EDF0FF|nr:uroporphyrinogen-III C-methyltransferase [Aquitalea sp. ASV11]